MENNNLKIEHIQDDLFSFECENGHIFKRNINYRYLSRAKCPKCYYYKNKFASYKLLLEKTNYELISFKNRILTVKCEKGHTFSENKNILFENKKACHICNNKKNKIKDFIQLQKENGINITSFDDKLVKYECENGHRFQRRKIVSYTDIIKCNKCLFKQKIKTRYKKILEEKNIELLSRNKKILTVKCKNGHIFDTYIHLVKNSKTGCAKCSRPLTVFEEQMKILKKHNFEYISGDNKNVIVKCENGHIINTYISSIKKYKHGCYKCYIINQKLTRNINILEKYNYEYISNSNNIFTVKCENGHIFNVLINKYHKNVKQCPECKKLKSKIKEPIDLLKDFNLEYISNSNNKFTIKCENGHIFNASINKYRKKIRECPECNRTKFKNQEKINTLKNLNFEYISNVGNNITVKCENGHIFTKYFYYLKNNKYSCKECKNKNYIYNVIYNELKRNNIKIISEEYKLLTCECENGHVFTRNIDSLFNSKYKCIKCNKLKNKKIKIKKEIEKLNKKFINIEDNIIKWECENGHINNIVRTAGYTKKLICSECENTK